MDMVLSGEYLSRLDENSRQVSVLWWVVTQSTPMRPGKRALQQVLQVVPVGTPLCVLCVDLQKEERKAVERCLFYEEVGLFLTAHKRTGDRLPKGVLSKIASYLEHSVGSSRQCDIFDVVGRNNKGMKKVLRAVSHLFIDGHAEDQ